MINFEAVPVSTRLRMCVGVMVYEGSYFGKETKSDNWCGYPILKIDDPKFHMCTSKNGECHGLWIQNAWDVIIAQKPANISELF